MSDDDRTKWQHALNRGTADFDLKAGEIAACVKRKQPGFSRGNAFGHLAEHADLIGACVLEWEPLMSDPFSVEREARLINQVNRIVKACARDLASMLGMKAAPQVSADGALARIKLAYAKGRQKAKPGRVENPVVSDRLGQVAGAAQPTGAKTKATETEEGDVQAAYRLLSVFTNGLIDDKLVRAVSVLQDSNLTISEKLTKIDGLIRLPAKVSAQQLARALRVTKQAVLQSDWWIQNRKGEKADEVGRRQRVHKERAKQLEPKSKSPADDRE